VRYNRIVRGLALVTAGISLVAAAATPAVARTATRTGPGEGVLVIAGGGGSGAAVGRSLPARETRVAASLVGFAARVRVRQTFNNPFDQPLEAIYTFPLPHQAAVSGIVVTVGKRSIKSEIKKRSEATEIFARARREGRTAALLEQERPNVFTQSVTNIPPGQVVQVEIVYDLALDYESGAFEFVYPMVVGPRYVPGASSGKAPSGHGTGPDTDQVPDGSRITPPTLPPGERSGRNVTMEVTLDPGKRIRLLESPTHDIAVERDDESTAVKVALVGRDRIPNKDFVLRYRLADATPVATAMAHQDGTFALMVEPPRAARARTVAKELVFLIDTSGSMRGEPLDRMKLLMRHAIGDLNPRDTFRIVTTAGDLGELGSRPLANTPAARRRALAAIDKLEAAGKSELLSGIARVLGGAVPRGRLRVICLMSDGFVGNEKAVLAAVERSIGPDTRLFTLGVGASVNRYLLERLAEVGRGASQVLLPGDEPEAQVAAFYRRVRSPVLTHIEIDWGGRAVTELWPKTLGDLHVGRPLTLFGRFERGGRGTITVRGRLAAGRPVSFKVPVAFVAGAGDNESLPRLWARSAIAGLEREQLRSDDPALVARITALGLQHRLVSSHTSFVAVDETRTKAGGVLRTYVVPVDRAEGVGATDDDAHDGAKTRSLDRDGEAEEEDSNREEPTAPPDLGEGAYSASVGGEMVMSSERAAPASAWRFAVGLGAGDLDRADSSGDLLVGSLHLRADRAVTGHLSLGVRLGALIRPDREGERVPLANLLVEIGGHSLWRGALRLMGGVGPVLVGGDTGGLGLGAAIGLGRRFPIELRYQHAIIDGEDASAVTLGLEAAF
jgi:Ca-activated chloride channel family protein